MKMKLGYIRNSTLKQENSVETQRKLINEYCETNGIELDQIIVDEGISGSGEKTNQREGYNQILDLIDQGFVETLVVISISRWGRNLGETYKSVRMMKEKNTTFISLKEMIDTKSIYGGFMINILSSLYEMELELIRERTKDTLRMKKENGKVYSKISFGYDRDGDDLIVNQKEMKLLKKMKRLSDQGNSFGEISKFLNRNKHKTKKGGFWTRQNVRHTIKNHPLFV
jgi:DNA invertase Pin-like site-specific DNA recombinase|tara:strand:- start:258 stop:938 length:681 start_codon:yes stop_codon:yes gene_type:complete